MATALALVRPGTNRLQHLAAAANRAHRSAMDRALEAGRALGEAKRLLPHGEFRRWVETHCCFSYRTARVYMQVASNPKMADSANSLIEALESTRTPGRYSFLKGDERWFSPRPIVDAARHVLGRIDLDPASEEEANRVVQARRFFTIKTDGLQQPWRGRLFCNPPYSATKISAFIERLVLHVESGAVVAAIFVVSAETEVKWFNRLASISSAVCFPRGRLKFWKPGTKVTGGAALGSAIMYVGPKPKRFGRAFQKFGHVWFS